MPTFASLLCLPFLAALGQEPKVADAPPVVVKVEPSAGTDDVDAAKVTEIRVTFSKAMRDQSWSWATAENFGAVVKATGNVGYAKDGKTFVVPVKLQPGTTYAVWINSDQFKNFTDKQGQSAIPYLLVFATKK